MLKGNQKHKILGFYSVSVVNRHESNSRVASSMAVKNDISKGHLLGALCFAESTTELSVCDIK